MRETITLNILSCSISTSQTMRIGCRYEFKTQVISLIENSYKHVSCEVYKPTDVVVEYQCKYTKTKHTLAKLTLQKDNKFLAILDLKNMKSQLEALSTMEQAEMISPIIRV